MINTLLKEYIEKNILPEYLKNDQGHSVSHIEYVLRRSLEFSKQVDNIDLDVVYAVACYHDIGHHINPKNHEKVSAEIFLQDKNMHNFFSDEQIKIIYEAIQDHRASSSTEPRSVYGKIVSSADRRTDMDNIMRTMFTYRFNLNPNEPIKNNIEDAYRHIGKKFAYGGYANHKIYFKDAEYEKIIEKAEYFKNNKQEFVKYYCKINNIDMDNL